MIVRIMTITFIIVYYAVLYGVISYRSSAEDTLVLKERLGTIMWHSSKVSLLTEPHVYCLYPAGSTMYPSKEGEYILKRADRIEDCFGWFGMAIFYELPEVSEREKFISN